MTKDIPFDIRKLLRFYLRRWWLMVLLTIIFAISSLYYTMNYVIPVYRASVMIYVNNSKITQIDAITSSNLSTSQRLVKTYINMIRRDSVLDKVADRLGGDHTAASIRSAMSAQQVEDTELFYVHISDPDATQAALIANTVAEVAPPEIEYFVEGSSTKIIDYAKVPKESYTPNYVRNIQFGGIVGLILAIFILTIRFLRGVRIDGEEDLLRDYGVPVLGSIPIFTRTAREAEYLSDGLPSYQADDAVWVHDSGDSRSQQASTRTPQQLIKDRSYLLTLNSDFQVQESYKTLRTNIFFSLVAEPASRTILITSPSQGEGKTITAANVAISCAEAENRVLLIDCDLRKPKLAKLLKLQSPVGLSNLMMKPELLDKAIVKTSVTGLSVLLSGDIPPNPSELLGTMRMKQLLAQLRERFDYIILDTPPIATVTDAKLLVPESDGVLIVIRTDHSEIGSITNAVNQLEHANAKILGFVLNGASSDQNLKNYFKHRSSPIS